MVVDAGDNLGIMRPCEDLSCASPHPFCSMHSRFNPRRLMARCLMARPRHSLLPLRWSYPKFARANHPDAQVSLLYTRLESYYDASAESRGLDRGIDTVWGGLSGRGKLTLARAVLRSATRSRNGSQRAEATLTEG